MHGMSTHVYLLVMIVFPLVLSLTVGVALPHIIHATLLLANPWAQEDWQLELVCKAIVEEHATFDFDHETWFIHETPMKTQVKATHKAARTPSARPLPAFIVRRHVVTRDEMLRSMDATMVAAHAEVIAAHSRELQAEVEALELKAALYRAIECAKAGYSSNEMKHLAMLVRRRPTIPVKCAEEISAARPHWRNPRGVRARLETALAYL